MSPELQDLLLKATYAGHRYHLAIHQQLASLEVSITEGPLEGRMYSEREEGMSGQYWLDWQALTYEAIALHERESS